MSDARTARHVQAALPLLEQLGFLFQLDLDDSITIRPPRADRTAEKIVELLTQHGDQVRALIDRRRHDLKRQFFGGPLDGRPTRYIVSPFHTYGVKGPDGRERILGYHLHHAGRARWAAYAIDHEGRAIFCGERPNKRRARLLALEKLDRIRG